MKASRFWNSIRQVTLLYFLLILVLPIKGQNRTGNLFSDLKKEFSRPSFHAEVVNDDDLTIVIHSKLSVIHYLFNKDSICYATIIYPFSEKIMNDEVLSLDKDYTRLAGNKWKGPANNAGSYFLVELIEDNYPAYCRFVWRLIELHEGKETLLDR